MYILGQIKLQPGVSKIGNTGLLDSKIVRITNENKKQAQAVKIIIVSEDNYSLAVSKLGLSGNFQKFEDKLVIGIPTKTNINSIIMDNINVDDYVLACRNELGRAIIKPVSYLPVHISTKILVSYLVKAHELAETAQELVDIFHSQLIDNQIQIKYS